MRELHRQVGAAQGIETADAAACVQAQLAERGLDGQADVAPGNECVQRAELAVHRDCVIVKAAFPRHREQVGRSGPDAQAVELRDARVPFARDR
jgi:hypothetical protein